MATEDEHARQTIGAHGVQFEEPDIIRIWLVGDVTADEGRLLLGALNRLAHRGPRLFILLDVSRLGAILPEARKLATRGHAAPLHANVIVGAGPLQRSALKLLDLAYRLISKDSNATPMIFVRTEAEGRAWIEQRREEIDGSGRGGGSTPPRA